MSDVQGWTWVAGGSRGRSTHRKLGDVDVAVPSWFTWRHDESGVTATLDLDVWDRLVVERLELIAERTLSPDGVTHETMRVPLARLARASVVMGPTYIGGREVVGHERYDTAARLVQQSRRKRKITPEFLGRVADIYNDHPGADPRQAVADLFDVSPSQASNYVRMARDQGLIELTRQGRPTHVRASAGDGAED